MCKNHGFVQEILHRINSAHLFCRIYKLTGRKSLAMTLVRLWESTPYYKMLYLKEVRARRKERHEQGKKIFTDKDCNLVA